jgi:hypothetical protein
MCQVTSDVYSTVDRNVLNHFRKQYNVEPCVSTVLYHSYVKKKSYEVVRRRFRHNVPASSTIFELVKKVRSTGSLT